ncbi:MAG: ZIP family metal transporter [Nitrospira sp.]|jgi:ZIP family zinc transporter|nr:ZIP family metal transporter [Nitrospira sp.]MDH4243631.1 ZIP family metal transporter [Nitrospira sp.]MDH4355158.1 ZIP family metal transporter [Nitrospira sp.]MDH5317545.1 ZIP family metal transporter [Nitrospira sp.]
MESLPASYVAVMALAFLSGGTTLLGVALAIAVGDNPKIMTMGIGFSTGMMGMISVFELIPESLSLAGASTTIIAAGLGAGLILALHILIPHVHLDRERSPSVELRAAYLTAFGLILHDVPEGFAMANAFLASPSLGILIAIAIALHNIPEEFAMAIPAVAVKNRTLLFKAAIASGLAEPAGAIFGLFAVHFNPALNPSLMAIAAGAMVMISFLELVPMARKFGKMESFALGIAGSVVVYLALHAVFSHEGSGIP